MRRCDIPPDILKKLNEGTLETATLAEGLAIDFRKLMKSVAPQIPAKELEQLAPEIGVTRRMRIAGEILERHDGVNGYNRLIHHPSDTVRGWAAFQMTARSDLSFKRRLSLIRPLADDPHFGVREWAWLALRDAVTESPTEAIQALMVWTKSDSANLRRYASEITRPRGVWCAHIDRFKNAPEEGLPLLEPLRSDTSLYVRNSVANWLNDAGKTQPDWVRNLCQRWLLESPTTETAGIVRRATRNL